MYLYTFKVKGVFHFPLDMLRYDCCFPNTQEDTGKIQCSLDTLGGIEETVELEAYNEKLWYPTVERWKSFGWEVIEHSQRKC